jgi:hypothetical protein
VCQVTNREAPQIGRPTRSSTKFLTIAIRSPMQLRVGLGCANHSAHRSAGSSDTDHPHTVATGRTRAGRGSRSSSARRPASSQWPFSEGWCTSCTPTFAVHTSRLGVKTTPTMASVNHSFPRRLFREGSGDRPLDSARGPLRSDYSNWGSVRSKKAASPSKRPEVTEADMEGARFSHRPVPARP